MSRRTERKTAVTYLYEIVMQKEDEMNFLPSYFEKYDSSMEKEAYAYKILSTYLQNKEEVNNAISENLQNWKMERLSKIDLAILRVATTEIIFFDDVPEAVSINEAVELAKTFSEEKSYKFVNKVLKNVLEAVKKETI